MARYLLAEDVDRFKGSLQGSTFQRSGKVFSIRKRNVPVQKRTAKQSQVKNNFDFVQKRWKDLSGPEQASFAAQTGNNLRTDSLGNTYELRSDQLQSSTNLNQIVSELPPLSTIVAPIAYVPFVPDTWGVDGLAEGMTLSLLPDLVQAGTTLRILSGALAITQQAFTKRDCSLFATLPAGTDTNTIDYWSQFIARYPAWFNVDLGWIPIFMETVQDDSGQVIGTFQDWCVMDRNF